jgi:hypothetical protein
MDYCVLNEVIVKNKYPLSRIDDLFSKIDLGHAPNEVSE